MIENLDNASIEGIPFLWSGRVTPDECRQIYRQLLRDRFFIAPVPGITPMWYEDGEPIGFKKSLPLLRDAVTEIERGWCRVYVIADRVVVLGCKSLEAWEEWTKTRNASGGRMKSTTGCVAKSHTKSPSPS